VLERIAPSFQMDGTIYKDAGVRFVIYKLWRTFPTRFVQAAGGDLVALNDILGHSTANRAIHYVQRTTQDYREAMKRYRLSTPLGGSKRITAAQKVYVGRTRNRTPDVSSLRATQQKVCKTFIRRFDPAPRLQQLGSFFSNLTGLLMAFGLPAKSLNFPRIPPSTRTKTGPRSCATRDLAFMPW
jgi:hypothetical protein